MTDRPISQSSNSFGVPVKLIQQTRAFIQDYSQTNELFEGEELTDELLGRCLVDTLDDWNYTPPILPVKTFANLMTRPELGGMRKWIVDMAGVRALRIMSIKHARQDMPYTAGNVNIQHHATWRNLEGIISIVRSEYEMFKTRAKLAENLEGGYRFIPTDMYDGFDAQFIDGAMDA